mgnify:CR=1 FL=1
MTDSVHLHFDAPRLGDAASVLYEQQEFWPGRPDPDGSGFDLVRQVIEDVHIGVGESNRFDLRLLETIHRFKTVLDGTFRCCRFGAGPTQDTPPAEVDDQTIRRAGQWARQTPETQQVRVYGILDMVRISTGTLGLRLEHGEEIRGVLRTDNAGPARELLGQPVILLGEAVFRPTGSLLRIDVDEVRPARPQDSFFGDMPRPRQSTQISPAMPQRGTPGGVAAIMGRWPGDETDADIARTLREVE